MLSRAQSSVPDLALLHLLNHCLSPISLIDYTMDLRHARACRVGILETMSTFGNHGSYEARLQGRILVFTARGPWNLESMDAAASSFVNLSQQLHGAPWGMVGIFYGEPVHVPEAASRLIEIVKEEKKTGRAATGIVLSHCDVPLLGEQHLTDIYTAAGETFAFFDTEAQATEWVESFILSASQ